MRVPIRVRYGWVERYISPVKLWVNSIGYFCTNEELFNALVPCVPCGTQFEIYAAGECINGATVGVEGIPEGWRVELETEGIYNSSAQGVPPVHIKGFIKPPADASPGIYPFRVKLTGDGFTRKAHALVLLAGDISYLGADMMEGADNELSFIEDKLAPSGWAFQGKGTRRFSISKSGKYQLWARLKGSGRSNGSVTVSLDGAPGKKCGVESYHGLAPRENGLDWMWAAGDVYDLTEGEHTVMVTTNGLTRAGGFLFVKIDENDQFQVILERLFLNRLYRPWADMKNL